MLHLSGGAKVAAYCPRLATAAAALWEHDSRHTGGIRPGMPLAEATALAVSEDRATVLPLPSRERAAREGRTVHAVPPHPLAPLHLEIIDPAADRLAIDELAEWCHRFSPTVGLEEAAAPESLLLDVTGLGRLFGGEGALARKIGERQRRSRHGASKTRPLTREAKGCRSAAPTRIKRIRWPRMQDLRGPPLGGVRHAFLNALCIAILIAAVDEVHHYPPVEFGNSLGERIERGSLGRR